VTFYLGDDQVRGSAGDAFVAPRGVPHASRVESKGGARWVVVSTPRRIRGLRSRDRGLAGTDSLDRDSVLGLREAVAVTVAAAENGIEIVDRPGVLPPEVAQPKGGPRTAARRKVVKALLPRPALASA
jgi:hypothetical protein